MWNGLLDEGEGQYVVRCRCAKVSDDGGWVLMADVSGERVRRKKPTLRHVAIALVTKLYAMPPGALFSVHALTISAPPSSNNGQFVIP